MILCPCNSNKRYLDCCGACIQLKAAAKSPEALMRSRYTAYVQENYDYIKKTMRPPASLHFSKKAMIINTKTKRIQWLGLEVISTRFHPDNPNIGWVEFKANYQSEGEPLRIYENSEFHLMDGKWYYVDGKSVP